MHNAVFAELRETRQEVDSQPRENPSNAPLDARYSEPFTIAAKFKAWQAQSGQAEPAVLQLRQTRDAIGTGTWTGGVVLARLLESLCIEGAEAEIPLARGLRKASVVELGSGTGVGGLAAALFCDFQDVTLTDLPGPVLENLQLNIDTNVQQFRERGAWQGAEVRATELDWREPGTLLPALFMGGDGKAPVSPLMDFSAIALLLASFPPCSLVLGADLVYEQDSVDPLYQVMEAFLLRPAAAGADPASFLFVNSTCGRPGYRMFKERLAEDDRFTMRHIPAERVAELAAPAFTDDVDVLFIQRSQLEGGREEAP